MSVVLLRRVSGQIEEIYLGNPTPLRSASSPFALATVSAACSKRAWSACSQHCSVSTLYFFWPSATSVLSWRHSALASSSAICELWSEVRGNCYYFEACHGWAPRPRNESYALCWRAYWARCVVDWAYWVTAFVSATKRTPASEVLLLLFRACAVLSCLLMLLFKVVAFTSHHPFYSDKKPTTSRFHTYYQSTFIIERYNFRHYRQRKRQT